MYQIDRNKLNTRANNYIALCRHLTDINSLTLHPNTMVKCDYYPILQGENRSHLEVRPLAQGHSAGKW